MSNDKKRRLRAPFLLVVIGESPGAKYFVTGVA